jgi:hypothetical protein
MTNNFKDDKVKEIMENYNLEEDEALLVLEIMEEYGVNINEAIEIKDSL